MKANGGQYWMTPISRGGICRGKRVIVGNVTSARSESKSDISRYRSVLTPQGGLFPVRRTSAMQVDVGIAQCLFQRRVVRSSKRSRKSFRPLNERALMVSHLSSTLNRYHDSILMVTNPSWWFYWRCCCLSFPEQYHVCSPFQATSTYWRVTLSQSQR